MIYSKYITNYDDSLEIIKDLKQNSKFSSFIQKCEKMPEVNFKDLTDFLIQPIQVKKKNYIKSSIFFSKL